jgi:FimV-like protein
MSRGQNPLVWMMALSLPGAANALGLGEIHVNSSLNEPLAAEIDIVGASAEELTSLTASIANRDTFLRFGAERPAFLSTATFKVAHDVKGRPVLAIRSTDSFTEPLVNLLVDLRWHSGEVIRQYSLLLDPAGFPAAAQVAAAVRNQVAPSLATPVALPAPAPILSTVTPPATVTPPTTVTAPVAVTAPDVDTAPDPAAARKITHMKIGAKATLHGIAWRVGARSKPDLQRLMLAIFRANPSAFDGNINRMHLGAVLTIPAAAEVASIPKADAGREIRAQMAAWRATPAKARAAAIVAPALSPNAAVASSVAAVPAAATSAALDTASQAALNLRVQTLEQGLHDVQAQLEREHDKLLDVQAQVRYAEKNPVSAPATPVAAPSRPWLWPSLFAGVALLAGAILASIARLRRRRAANESRDSIPSSVAVREETHNTGAKIAPALPITAEPLRHDAARPSRPVAQEAPSDLSAAWNSVRDKQEAKAREQASAKSSSASRSVTTPKVIVEVNEEELRAAYEDTLDLCDETAVLAAEIAAASADTGTLPAATLNLNAALLQETARMDAETARLEVAGIGAADIETASIESTGVDTGTMLSETELMGGGAATMRVDTNKLDYNLMDLDLTAHHVQMPSVLHEEVVVKERRTNLVDVLKMAIEREPGRSDLRMKLLETYYAAASTNRQGFLDVVQNLARDRDRLGAGEWDKIAFMGRQIAADTGLFAAQPEAEDDNQFADCA